MSAVERERLTRLLDELSIAHFVRTARILRRRASALEITRALVICPYSCCLTNRSPASIRSPAHIQTSSGSCATAASAS